jgi:hypothetical protein
MRPGHLPLRFLQRALHLFLIRLTDHVTVHTLDTCGPAHACRPGGTGAGQE